MYLQSENQSVIESTETFGLIFCEMATADSKTAVGSYGSARTHLRPDRSDKFREPVLQVLPAHIPYLFR